MRLLFVNYECPPIGGGAGFAMLALARELVTRGHEVDILTGSGAVGEPPDVGSGIRILRVCSYRRSVHNMGMLGAASFLCSAALALPALTRRRHYDALHYYFGLPTGALSQVPGPHRALRG